jgi:hypothetical protein
MTVAAVVMATTQAQMKKKRRGNKKQAAADELARQVKEEERKAEEANAPPKHWTVKILMSILDVLNSLTLQTCLYITFVIIFQNLANTMRLKQEVNTAAAAAATRTRAAGAAIGCHPTHAPPRGRWRPLRARAPSRLPCLPVRACSLARVLPPIL